MSAKPYAQSLFTRSALLSGLVTENQIREVVHELVQSGRSSARRVDDVTDHDLSDDLVRRGLLTTYQSEQLRAGRNKFTLGNYVITDFIGQGGMGQVFKGVHQVMGRVVAIKVLPLKKTNEYTVDSFLREVRAQARLDHPNLVRAYDAGKDNNVYYLVVEYVRGTDLRRLLRSRGKLSIQQAASIIRQAAEGLEFAHQQKMIHRDVKPGNILVTPDGIAKVSDLGLAAIMAEGEDDDPRQGKVVGTADYLSPEQIQNPTSITRASDIYSLGCTLYYAVTGKVPFPGGNAKQKARRHLEETPWHPRRFNEEISDEFVDLIADMMEKSPVNRIQSAAEVAARLEPWAADVSPISGAQMTRSRWHAAPLPTGRLDDLQENDGESLSSTGELGTGDYSQGSQGTAGGLGAFQETTADSVPPPPPMLYDPTGFRNSSIRRIRLLTRLLWILVPLAGFFGAAFGLLVGRLLK